MTIKAFLFTAVGAAGLSAFAALPGWKSDFHAATNTAVVAHKPLVLFWGDEKCEHCAALEADVQNKEFREWQDASGYEFCFILGKNKKDPDSSLGAKEFAKTAGGTQNDKRKWPTSFPFICVYWQKKDGNIVAKSFTTESASVVRDIASQYFAGWVNIPDYIGGDFAFTNDMPCARLEAEVGFTEYVDIPLVRAGEAKDFAATNMLTVVRNGSEIQRVDVVWLAGTLEKEIRVAIPANVVAGETLVVNLVDGKGSVRGTTGIHIVDEQENATTNPLFLGERTARTLGYGEWTMDLDVALAKYKAEPEAHLLAVASGSLWCPDCVMTDAHVLESAAFKQWAVDNKVVLVDIDVPNFPNTTNSACLLTRVVARTSDGYISGRGTLATNETMRYQSGAGYLSRHMVGAAAAAAVLARNRSLVGKNTLQGGWNNPDRANQNRTGIPNFFALRRDGVVVGTFETFDAIGPSAFNDAYLKRFSELIALCNDNTEEFLNRSWQTTKDGFFGEGESAKASLSAIDLVDVYRLAAITDAAAEQKITVRGSDTNTMLTVSLIAVVDGVAKTLSVSSGILSDGVTVSGLISRAGAYYVQISGAASGTLAVDSDSPDTSVEYSLQGWRSAIPNPYSNDWISKAINTTLPLLDGDGLVGTLSISLKKSKKITAKFSNGKKMLVSFSGKWNDEIAADGMATAVLAKGEHILTLRLSQAGAITAEISEYGAPVLSSGRCLLADTFADFSGTYLIALPPVEDEVVANAQAGVSYMTLKMATTSAARKSGKFKFSICLADGKTLSGSTNVTGLDANFGIVPVLKSSGVNTLSAAVKLRRNAATAPSRRAAVSVEDVPACWVNTKAGHAFSQVCDIYGSYYDRADSLIDAAGTSTLAWTADATPVAYSVAYGHITGIAGSGSAIEVTANMLSLAQKTSRFTFKFNGSSGVFSGRTALSFEKKAKVSATYKGILLPGWFSDCDCGEDDDTVIERENLPFGLGYIVFQDANLGGSGKRSLAVGLTSVKGD